MKHKQPFSTLPIKTYKSNIPLNNGTSIEVINTKLGLLKRIVCRKINRAGRENLLSRKEVLYYREIITKLCTDNQ